MRVARKDNGAAASDAAEAVLDRDEATRERMALEIDRYGGDGPMSLVTTHTVEDLVETMAETCWELGRDDVLRRLSDPQLDDAGKLERLGNLVREHFGLFMTLPKDDADVSDKKNAEKEILGYRVRDSSEHEFYATASDDINDGYWWNHKSEAPLMSHEDATALLAKVKSCNERASIVVVTRKKRV